MVECKKSIIQTEPVACDLCGGNATRQLYKIPDLRFRVTDQEFHIVSCQICGHRYLNPRPTAGELIKCYPEEYYNLRGRDIPKQRDRYIRQAKYFKDSAPGRFLDIGCAQGAFCTIMMDLGWDCYGMDFSEQPTTALPKGLKFESGSLEKIAYPDNYFDGISAWGVFEHLLTPKTYFREAARILKPGGIFVIMVPNANSLWSRFSYKEDIPRHIQFFSKRIIQKYAEISNLEIVKFDFTNSIYSRPATGRDCIRINLLRSAGVPWRELNCPQKKFHLKLISFLGTLFGRLLIYPFIEEKLGLSGIIVTQFTKI